MEEGSQSTEDPRGSLQHSEDMKANVAVEKSQHLSFPHTGMGQLSRKRGCSSIEEYGSCSILGMAQLGGNVAELTTDEQAEDGAEGPDTVLPVGSGQVLGEHKEQVLASQSSPDTPLSPITGKRLRRSIQKVHEWLSKSQEVPSSSPLKDVPSAEVDWDLNPTHLSDADSSGSLTIGPGEQQQQEEATVECEDDKPLFRPTASKIEDKVFGRTYKRERKSTPLRNEMERTHIRTEESLAANTKPRETLMRRSTARKRKATSELTPEHFIKRHGAEGSSKRFVRDGNTSLEVCGQACTLVNDRSVAEQKVAELPFELPVKEGASVLEAHAREEPQSICHSWSESDLKTRDLKTKKPLGKRGKTLSKSFGTLELIVDARSRSPEMAQIQGDVEEPSDVASGQKKVRRSRRLQLLTEGVWSGDKDLQLQSESTGRPSEPTKRERKQVDRRVKTRRWSQAGIMPSPSATDDPGVLQGLLQKNPSLSDTSPRDMEDEAGTELASSPRGSGIVKDTSEEQTPDGLLGPGCLDRRAGSQGSCSLLHFLPPVAKQAAPEDKGFEAHPPEKGAQPVEGNGPSTGCVTRSSKPIETIGKTAAPLELNPETDESELDTGFVRKIFSCCKRQSFLLHRSQAAESATEIQRKLRTGRMEDDKLRCIKKPTQNEEGKEAVSSGENRDISVQRSASSASDFPEPENRTEHLQLASQTPSPDCLYVPLESAAKNVKVRNRPPSPKPTTDKIASLEIGREPASPNADGTHRSPQAWRNGNSQGSSYVNEINSSMDYFRDAGSVEAQSQGLALSARRRSGSMGKKQLNSNVDEATDSSSGGVPKCFVRKENLKQGCEEGSRGFDLSVETPDGLLDPINEKEGSSKLWGMDRSDVLVLSAETGEQPPLGRELESSDQSSWSKLKKKGPTVAQQRQARKLPSSEEEESSEDEELPCFQALLFGTASRSMKEKETAAEMPAPKSTSRSNFSEKDEDVCPSQESEGSVNLFSSHSPGSGDSASEPCDSKRLTPSPSPRRPLASPGGNKETIKSSSKVSKDTEPLKDGQREGVNAESNLGTKL